MTAATCPTCGTPFPLRASGGLCPSCLLALALADEDDTATTIASGTVVGGFRIVTLLGRGGMASVYEAEDLRLERAVALKVLPPEFLHDAGFARRFEQEARVIAKLEHPHVVPIYASGIDGGVPWMSMRLLSGGNLAALLERGRLSPGAVVDTLRDVALALDYAHTRGIVHRDIKPSNLLLDGNGRVCVGDFGLARIRDDSARLTRSGTFAGTPHYMAPEQALGGPADYRCDIYSLGIVAYEMLVGHAPFTADNPMAVLLKQVHEPMPEPPAGVASEAVMRALRTAANKEPADRWPSASAFVDALREAVAGGPVRFGSPAPKVSPSSSAPRRVAIYLIAASLVAVAAAGLWRSKQPRPIVPPMSEMNVPASDRALPADGAAEPIRDTGAAAERSNSASSTGRDGSRPAAANPVPLRTRRLDTAPAVLLPSGDTAAEPLPRTSPQPSDDSPPTVTSPGGPVNDLQPADRPVADVIVPAIRLRSVDPEYPTAARAAQIEGDVVLQLRVGADGRISEVTVTRSVHPLLDEAARKAALQYQYAAARRNGVPEASTIRIAVSFRLR